MKPPLTICMPLYNEAATLQQTMAGLLTQTYGDFQILVSDNASTDGTLDMLHQFASKDQRIAIIRCPHNIGSAANWRLLQQACETEYVMFASGHDQYQPRFVEACLQPFLEDTASGRSRVVLCYPNGEIFNAAGLTRALEYEGILDTRGLGLLQRVHTVSWFLKSCHQMYGIIRTEALKEAYFRPVIGPDNLLLIELAFWGTFVYVPEKLFRWRQTGDVNVPEAYRRKLFVNETGDDKSLALKRVKEVVHAYMSFLEKYQNQSHLDTLGKTALLTAALYKVRLIASYYRVEEETLFQISANYRQLYQQLAQVNAAAEYFCTAEGE